MHETPKWEVYAIRYAHHERLAHENFLAALPADIHDGPMPLDYYVWIVRRDGAVYVLDTGFDEAMARKRGREFLHSPGDGLRAIGVEPSEVKDVILSHMHYDHCGNHALFPNARYHVQDREMMFSTGRHMCHAHMRFPFDEEDVVAMVRKLFAGRVVFHDGDQELAPGLSLHYVGGHSMGLQMLAGPHSARVGGSGGRCGASLRPHRARHSVPDPVERRPGGGRIPARVPVGQFARASYPRARSARRWNDTPRRRLSCRGGSARLD